MSRERSNCRTTLVAPSALDDVISVTPAMRPNWRSSGVATADAMVSGLAPGSAVLDDDGRDRPPAAASATGRLTKASAPASASASVSSVVATGRRMNGSEMLTAAVDRLAIRARASRSKAR